MNLAGTIPGWTRFPPAQEMVNRATAARASSIRLLRASRRRARHLAIRPSKSGCSISFWNGASNRSGRSRLDHWPRGEGRAIPGSGMLRGGPEHWSNEHALAPAVQVGAATSAPRTQPSPVQVRHRRRCRRGNSGWRVRGMALHTRSRRSDHPSGSPRSYAPSRRPACGCQFKLVLPTRFRRTASFAFGGCLRRRRSLMGIRLRPEPGPCLSSLCRR